MPNKFEKTKMRLNLGQSFELFKLQSMLSNCSKQTIFGVGIRQAMDRHDTSAAVTMIKNQIADGHIDTVKKVIGEPALILVNKLAP